MNKEKPQSEAENGPQEEQGDGEGVAEGMTENEVVALILVVTLVGLIIFAAYIYTNRRYYGIGSLGG